MPSRGPFSGEPGFFLSNPPPLPSLGSNPCREIPLGDPEGALWMTEYHAEFPPEPNPVMVVEEVPISFTSAVSICEMNPKPEPVYPSRFERDDIV